jgi:hypothetical protein
MNQYKKDRESVFVCEAEGFSAVQTYTQAMERFSEAFEELKGRAPLPGW